MSLPLFALFLAAFGIGTSEFAPIGLLPNIAQDLHVSIPQAGYLISCYAISVTIGSPLLAILTSNFRRHAVMLLLISFFILGNFLASIAHSYQVLLIARVITALSHGAFFGLGAVVAASVVPAHKKAQGISMMFAGFTIANIVGVPFATAMGQRFGWHSAFVGITCLGFFACGALYCWIPRHLKLQSPNLHMEFKAIRNMKVGLTMLTSVLSSVSLLCVFAYITPTLESVTRIPASYVTLVLMVFGVGFTIGNIIGGKLADWRLMPSLLGILTLLVMMFLTFSITVHFIVPAILTIFVWGMLAFALISPLQTRVVKEAAGAPNLVSTLNQASFHLGNSIGALISGLAISYGVSYQHLPMLGASVAFLALMVTYYSYSLDNQASICMSAASSDTV